MKYDLLIAVLAGLGGMLGWGLADFFAKKTIDQIGDILTLAWGHIFGTLVLILLVIYQATTGKINFSQIDSTNIWLGLIFFGILQGVVYFFVYKGFGKGQVTLLAPIFASFSGLVALFSILFLGESISLSKILVLGLIFAGVLMISLNLDALQFRKIDFSHISGLKEVAFATIMATVWTLLWDKFVGGRDWLLYTMLMYLFMTVAIVAYVYMKGIVLLPINNHLWKFLFFIGTGEILAYLAISIGYSTTSMTSIVALISGAFALPTIILAYIFLKERVAKAQIFGGVLIIAGIALLSIV